jgi:hypothetical protein
MLIGALAAFKNSPTHPAARRVSTSRFDIAILQVTNNGFDFADRTSR